jgi:hypothetical protein
MLDRGSSITSDPLFCQTPGPVANTALHMTDGVLAVGESAESRHPHVKLCG